MREKKQQYVKREKEVLMLLSDKVKTSAPFFVRLYCTFHDHSSLCKYLLLFNNVSLSWFLISLICTPCIHRFCSHTCYKWWFTNLSSKSREIWWRSSTVLYCWTGPCSWTHAPIGSRSPGSKTREYIARHTQTYSHYRFWFSQNNTPTSIFTR